MQKLRFMHSFLHGSRPQFACFDPSKMVRLCIKMFLLINCIFLNFRIFFSINFSFFFLTQIDVINFFEHTTSRIQFNSQGLINYQRINVLIGVHKRHMHIFHALCRPRRLPIFENHLLIIKVCIIIINPLI